LKATGFEDSALGAAAFYADLAATFVLDSADYYLASEVERYDFKVKQADTLVQPRVRPEAALGHDLETAWPSAIDETGGATRQAGRRPRGLLPPSR
jgi:hypothetical protein